MACQRARLTWGYQHIILPHPCQSSHKEELHPCQDLFQGFTEKTCPLPAAACGLVGKTQGAFPLHDNFLMVKESAAMLREKRIYSLLLKLDIAKAFDTVNWQFFIQVLRKVGFGNKWIAWIEMMLSSASTRIILNDDPGPPIWHACGLRPGDALSPMIFIILMDVLRALFDKAEEAGLLSRLTHAIPQRLSLYADDVIAFIKACPEEAHSIRFRLDLFAGASGLRCNKFAFTHLV